jgi:hypothetical protein
MERRRTQQGGYRDHEQVRIAITGSTGLIGTALVTRLHAAGHDVVRLVRRSPRAGDEVRWDPMSGEVDLTGLAGVEAAVHLAGAGAGDRRLTASYQKTVRDSRVQGTRTLATALTKLDPLPRVLACGSAVGFYGDRGDEPLTESSGPGEGFFPEFVQAWEASTASASDAGVRVVHARTGLVLTPDGGALARMLPFARLGLGGPLGSGRQWWPWITLDDEVRILEFLLEKDIEGPVNLCAPQPARNSDVARALGRALHRPALLPAPAFALSLLLGEFAEEVLGSKRVVPARLLDAGFTFGQRSLEQGIAWALRQG